MLMPFSSLLLVTLVPLSALGALSGADVVLLHGKIWTENPAQPIAEALAITGNRIADVGKLIGPQTKVIDLQGRRVVPGFNDAHVHFYTGGASLTSVQLRNARSEAEFRERIRAYARSHPKGEWILNGSWDHENWNPARLPTHSLIDDVTPANPVFVNRSDGHMMLANALAMKLAGISRDTKDVPGGVIVRDSDGNPTGIFKDAANALIARVIPPPSGDQILNAVRAAQNYAAENGVTSVQDMGVLGDVDTTVGVIEAFQELRQRDELRVRISGHLPLRNWKRLADVGIRSDFGDEKLNLGAVKAFADGSLGSSTAWFFEPFTDAPGNSGIPSDELVNPAKMYEEIQSADRAGLQIAIHAIGDRANNTILNFYEKLEQQDGMRDRRLRIEHAQHLLASDIPRFGSLRVIASVQPYHCIDDGRWAESRIGADRARRTYAFRSLLDSGPPWHLAPTGGWRPLVRLWEFMPQRPGARCEPAASLVLAISVGCALSRTSEVRQRRSPLSVFFAQGGEPLQFGVDADSTRMDGEVEDDRVVQLQNLLELLEIGGANEDLAGVVSFDDEDGERVFFRPADVSLVEVPLWAVEPELRAEGSDDELDVEAATSAASMVSQVQ
jgi:predicted amidohydrolase YtcJ